MKKAGYTPSLKMRQSPGGGYTFLLRAFTKDRFYLLFSKLEQRFCLYFDFVDWVEEIKEQYGLDLPTTRRIAGQSNIKHPRNRKNRIVQMTTDLLLRIREQNEFDSFCAICIKHSHHLNSPRVRDKIEIEKQYWAMKQIPFYVLTEKHVNPVADRNLNFLVANVIHNDPIESQVLSLLKSGEFRPPSVVDLIHLIIEELQVPESRSRRLVYSLFAKKYLLFDFETVPFNEGIPVKLSKQNEYL